MQLGTPDLQISGVKLHLNNNVFYLYNIYNQPSCNYNLNVLNNIIPNINGSEFLLIGDFNSHHPLWDNDCIEADANGSTIEQFVDNNNLCILNNSNVHTYYSRTHGSFSSIDLSICTPNIVERFEWNVLEDFYSSDHSPILISCLNDISTPNIQKYNTDKADWEMYRHHTKDIPRFNALQDHDEAAEFLTTYITKAADKCIPVTSGRPLKHSVPWWSDTLSQLISEKQQIGRKLESLNKRFKNLINRTYILDNTIKKLVDITIEISMVKPYYNKVLAKFRKEAIRGRIISWQKYVSSISENTSITKVWQKFRKINGSHISSPRHALLQNGIRIHNTKDISNILGRSIEYISSNDNLDAHFRSLKTRAEAVPINFETMDDIYYNRKFVVEELEYALTNCTSSAPGIDRINFAMILNLAPSAKAWLLQYYNHLWTKHVFPKAWKHAIVIPIAKPGKDPSIASNYRPISLTSCLCKLMEKMVNYRLNYCLRKRKVLSPYQFGSQTERSSLDSLSHVENYVKRGFERKQVTVAIFFDIQKAYDTTWRHLILKNLYNNGFRGHLPHFIKNFIYERTFQTRIENVLSDTYQLENGVPQGSVLSGTLFALAINDIASQLPNGVQHNLYVDDFAIYYRSTNLRHLQRILNNAIQKIVAWTESVGFKLSIGKTQAIMFYKNVRWKKNQDITLTMNTSQIQFQEKVKFLGLVFDTHMNWKAHVSYIKSKCNSALNLMKKLSSTKWGAQRSTLLIIYKALVLSRLDYGSPVYGSASQAVLKTLDPIHTRGLRLCTGAFRSSPNSSVLCESGEPPLSLHRDMVTMRSALKIMSCDSPTKNLFNMRDVFINNHVPPFPIRATRLLAATNINISLAQPAILSPPWTMGKIRVCYHLTHLSRRYNHTPSHYLQLALEHIQRKGPHYAIYTDGSKSSAGVGCAAVSADVISKFSLPKEASIFTAELTAIFMALNQIKTKENKLSTTFIIYSDSKSAIEAISNYKSNNHIVRKIKNTLNKLYTVGIQIEICWVPAHVGLEGNEKADIAAKEAINSRPIDIKLPVGDYINVVKQYIKMEHQKLWDEESNNNKLKQIKPFTSAWKSSSQSTRIQEVILTRLRIGHTRLTHGFLMSDPKDPAPRCHICNVPLSIKHILIECINFNRQRAICFAQKSFNDILTDSTTFSMSRILIFLRMTKFIDKI